MRPWLLAVLLTCSCACDVAAPATSGGTAELGTGGDAWQPLIEGQELELVTGGQGGHHFVVRARIQDMVPGDPTQPAAVDNPSTEFAVFLGDERIDLEFPPFRLGYLVCVDGWFDLGGGRIARIDESALPYIYGSEVRIVVEVIDFEGRHAIDDRTVIAVRDGITAPPDAGTTDAY